MKLQWLTVWPAALWLSRIYISACVLAASSVKYWYFRPLKPMLFLFPSLKAQPEGFRKGDPEYLQSFFVGFHSLEFKEPARCHDRVRCMQGFPPGNLFSIVNYDLSTPTYKWHDIFLHALNATQRKSAGLLTWPKLIGEIKISPLCSKIYVCLYLMVYDVS